MVTPVTCHLSATPLSSVAAPYLATTARQSSLSLLLCTTSPRVRPVIDLILSIYDMDGLPLLRFPSTLPWKMDAIKSVLGFLMACPRYFSFLLLISFRSVRLVRSSSKTLSFVLLSCQLIRNRRLYSHISAALSLFSSCFRMVQASHPYIRTGHTKHFSRCIFKCIGTLLSFHTLFSCIIFCFAIAILAFTSCKHVPSLDFMDPRYLKLSTLSKTVPLTLMLLK